MAKVVLIGAGSDFGPRLARDVLACAELQDAHLVLCDIDGAKAAAATRFVQRIAERDRLPAVIEAATDYHDVLRGADFVITSISVGGPAYHGFPATVETNIPARYGVSQSVADTIGVGGIFRFLRTAPVQLDICAEMEAVCPDALLLNYTNPMAMLTWAQSLGSSISNVGLCHSVQGTAWELAHYLGVPANEVTYTCAGINHQAWYLRYEHKGVDMYPAIEALLDVPETVAKDRVRFEMLKHFGWFVTESSTHCSEYHPYFRRTAELREHFGLTERIVEESAPAGRRPWLDEPMTAELPPREASAEFASGIIRAIVTDQPYRFNGNVMNTGLIENLPESCCVEVPCMVDSQGVHPCYVGALPTQLAALNASNVCVQELAVEAILEHDRDAAFHACAMDPLTRAVLDLDTLRDMFDEMWDAEGELLDWFNV